MMSEESSQINVASNYQNVMQKIDEAARKSDHSSSDITVVGVSKRIEFSRIKQAIDAGLGIIGEIVSTELKRKLPQIREYSTSIDIQIVGLMQSNKVKFAVENCKLIQSLQTEKILTLINKFAQRNDVIYPVYLQVDFSQTSKPKGLNQKEVLRFMSVVDTHPYVEAQGVMAIAPLEFENNPLLLRKLFAKTRNLFYKEIVPKLEFENPQLSMGMTNDYEIAIEEGSTMVRLGTAIFGPRLKK